MAEYVNGMNYGRSVKALGCTQLMKAGTMDDGIPIYVCPAASKLVLASGFVGAKSELQNLDPCA